MDSAVDLGEFYSSDCTYAAITPTGADLQAACLADELCVGLTTTAAGSPLCLLRAGRGADPFRGMSGRWLMQKATADARTCSIIAANSGTITVLLRQTSFASSIAVVLIGDAVAAQCGGLKPFAGGLFGRSSACGLWMPCYVGRVHVNDTIRVVASAAMTAGGCDGSVGVLFDIIFDAVDQTRPPEPRIPSQLSMTNLRLTFSHSLFIKIARRSFLRVLAYNVERLLLDVAQTGYDCTMTPAGFCTRPAVQLLAGSSVIQQCGGTSPFLLNVTGASDQCTQPRFCGMPVFVGTNTSNRSLTGGSSSSGSLFQSPDSSLFVDGSSAAGGVLDSRPASGYVGWLQLSVDIAGIRYASSLCPYFAAKLFASSSVGNSSNISGFVLHSGSGGRFAVLAASRIGSDIVNFTKKAIPNAVALPMIGEIFGNDDVRFVFLVNTSSYLEDLTQAKVATNASFACVMDWISEDSGSCVIPIPVGANFVTIRVAQTNFAPTANVMSIIELDRGA